MAYRRDHKGRSSGKEPRHVRLYHYMLDSEAWKDLGAIPRALYIEISRRYHGTNNGSISYSVREAASALKISKATASRSFADLIEHGFIEKMKQGAFSLKLRHATEWRLTERLSDITNGAPIVATKEFMRWSRAQNTVPVVRLSVPLVKPIGPRGETKPSRNTSHGPSGETVKADFRH